MKDLYAKVQEYFARTERLEERVRTLEAQLASTAGTADTHTGAATGSLPVSAETAANEPPIITNEDDSAATVSRTTTATSSMPEQSPSATDNDQEDTAVEMNDGPPISVPANDNSSSPQQEAAAQ